MNLDKQQGFTMIELIMVIVILGILAATALPKFVDLTGESKQAAVDGVAGAANSAMAINYAGCMAVNNNSTANPTKCTKVTTCAGVASLLQGGLPSNYTAAAAVSGTEPGTTNGTTASCTISFSGKTANFTGISAGN